MASRREVAIILKAVDRASKTLKRFSRSTVAGMQRIAQHGEEAGRGLAMIGAAGTLAFGLAVNTAADFQQAMVNTQSVIGGTQAQLETLTLTAREMGKESIFSARQAADAMYFLGSAGFDTQKIISSLSGVLSLAAATQADLAFTSQTVVTTLAVFNLTAEESTRVANVFAAAISGSQATIDRLATSLGYIGPIAASINMSLEETTAILGLLFNKGIDASTAGTSLRMSISKLLKPTTESMEALNRLQVSIADADGFMRDFVDIVRDLEAAGLNTADAMRIFGVRAGPSMLALISTGADAIEAFKDEITGTNKAAVMAEMQIDTFRGQLRLLKSALQELQIVIGDTLLPILREYADRLTDIVNKTSEWAKLHPVLSAGVVKIGGGLSVFFAIVGGGLLGISMLVKSIAALALIIGGPATWITAGILALVAGITGLALWSKRADPEVMKLVRSLEMLSSRDLIEGNEETAESFGDTVDKIEEMRAKLTDLENEYERLQGLAMTATTAFKDSATAIMVTETRIAQTGKEIKSTREELELLEEAARKFVGEGVKMALPKRPKVVIPSPADVEETEAILKLREELSTELARLTKSETDFRIFEVERWAEESKKVAEKDADLRAEIEYVTQRKIAAIRQEARDQESEANMQRAVEMMNIIGMVGTEAQAREAAARIQAKQILDATGNAMLANQFLQDQLARIRQDDLDADADAADKKQAMMDNHHIRTLELQGKMKEAALERLNLERLAMEADDALTLEQKEYLEVARIAIEKRYRSMSIEDARQAINDLNARRIEMETELQQQIESLRESAFDKEQRRIQRMERSYTSYIRTASSVWRQFAAEQEGGWLRALAILVRFISRAVAGYLRQRAMEKLRQADIANTQRTWALAHAARMTGLAIEAGAMALMAGAAGLLWGDPTKLAAAKLYTSAATAFGAAAGKAATEAAAFQTAAVAAQAEAATLMTASVAVETAGEVAAAGLDRAADRVRKLAREREEQAKKEERALDTELQLRQRILELEGRTFEARQMGIQQEIDRYRELGISADLLSRYQQLSLAEAATAEGGTVTTPAPVPIGAGVTDGPTVVIYQDNDFSGFINTADEEQLRELAELIAPYTEEIEDLETTP